MNQSFMVTVGSMTSRTKVFKIILKSNYTLIVKRSITSCANSFENDLIKALLGF